MFEKLVVSSTERRKHRTARFFAVTVLIYAGAFAAALVLSVTLTNPNLADTGLPRERVYFATDFKPVSNTGGIRASAPPAQKNLLNVKKFEDVIQQLHQPKPQQVPVLQQLSAEAGSSNPGGGPYIPGTGSGEPGTGGPGIPGLNGPRSYEPPPRPEPAPAPRQAEQPKPTKLPSLVLQGKAIQKITPPYNAMAVRIRLQGQVSVEVIVDPEGRVESARVVSGHPLLAKDARDAAMSWRFQPTLLNNVPVRVTGVIVFNFRMGE